MILFFLNIFLLRFWFLKKLWKKKLSNFFFFAIFFSNFLESFETHFNPVANKIEVKLNFFLRIMVIYGDIVVNWVQNQPFLKKIKKTQKSENYFSIGFWTLRIFWDKNMVIFGHLFWSIFPCILSTKLIISQKIKS